MPSWSATRSERNAASNHTGRLHVVGTPIGNLTDITLRAIETLKRVDRVLAEDTRRTRALLNHLGIGGKPLASIEAHVSESRLQGLLAYLLAGETLALVTDAGMPAVSDPGAKFIALARDAGIAVEVVPGPSALTAAIATSGLVEGPFYFAGFLPRQGSRRTRALDQIRRIEGAAVLFEAGNRTAATLADLARQQPERRAAVCRELTKVHEEVTVLCLRELAALEREWRGEVVIVLGGEASSPSLGEEPEALDDATLLDALGQGKSVRDLLDASELTGQARRALYTRLLELRRHQSFDRE